MVVRGDINARKLYNRCGWIVKWFTCSKRIIICISAACVFCDQWCINLISAHWVNKLSLTEPVNFAEQKANNTALKPYTRKHYAAIYVSLNGRKLCAYVVQLSKDSIDTANALLHVYFPWQGNVFSRNLRYIVYITWAFVWLSSAWFICDVMSITPVPMLKLLNIVQIDDNRPTRARTARHACQHSVWMFVEMIMIQRHDVTENWGRCAHIPMSNIYNVPRSGPVDWA